MNLDWLYTFFASLGSSLAAMPIMIATAHRFGILDTPDAKARGELKRQPKLHVGAIPRIGGIAMLFSFSLGILLTIDSLALSTVYLCSMGLFLTGLLDDIRPVSAKIRLLMQLGLVAWLIIGNKLFIKDLLIFDENLPIAEILGYCLAAFILVGSINAINMIDGMDGLAAGVSLISILMLSYLHFLQTEQTWILTLLSISVIGAVVGFLKFNSYPAKIFMGDGGSNWLGFIMGVMIVLTLGGFTVSEGSIVRANNRNTLPLISVLLCVAIPAIDTFLVILKRLLEGKHPFSPDHGHFHHVLLKFGLMEKRVVVTIYFIAFVSAAIGVLPIAYPKYNLAWVPYVYFVLLFGFMAVLRFGNQGTLGYVKNFMASRKKFIGDSKAATNLLRVWSTFNRYCIYAIVAASPFFCGVVPKDLASTALIILPIVAITLPLKSKQEDFLQVLIITLGASIILIAVNSNALKVMLDEQVFQLQPYYNALFITLGISSLFYFILTINRYHLRIGPTDFLLLTIPLVMLLIPDPWRTDYRLATISARCLVLFAAMRTIAFGYHNVIRRLKLLVVIGLIYISLNGLVGFKFIY